MVSLMSQANFWFDFDLFVAEMGFMVLYWVKEPFKRLAYFMYIFLDNWFKLIGWDAHLLIKTLQREWVLSIVM